VGKTPEIVMTMKGRSKTPRKAPPVTAATSRMTRSAKEKTNTGPGFPHPSPPRESRSFKKAATHKEVPNKSTPPSEKYSVKKKAMPLKQDVSIRGLPKPTTKLSTKTTTIPPKAQKTPESVCKELGLQIPPHILAATGSSWDPHSGRRQSRRNTLPTLSESRSSLPVLAQPSSAPPKRTQKQDKYTPSKSDAGPSVNHSRTRNSQGRYAPEKGPRDKEDKVKHAGSKGMTSTPLAKAGSAAVKRKYSSQKGGSSKEKAVAAVEKDPYDFSDEE